MIKWLKKKHFLHSWEFIDTQITKRVSFGCCGIPGYRSIEKCEVCGEVRKTSHNMAMPNKYLKKEYDNMWR